MSLRQKLPVGWLAGLFLVFVLVNTYFTTAAINSPVAHAKEDNVRCETGEYTKYITIGNGPVTYTETRMNLSMRVCWKAFDSKNEPGQIIKNKTDFDIRFNNTSWGDMEGWRWGHDPQIRFNSSNAFIEVVGVHAWARQCVGTPVTPICGPTLDFYPRMQFMSPYITEPRMHNGIFHNWEFHSSGNNRIRIFSTMQ